jgi:hypothetical protein
VNASTSVGEGRYSIYTGRVTNWPMVAVSAALVVPLLLLGTLSGGDWRSLAIPMLVAATGVLVNMLTGSSVRTSTGTNGVSVRFGLLGWPRCTYRLEEIQDAEVVGLPPWRVALGFWWTPRNTFCTVRSGAALQLTLRNGRKATITVPDAQAAAAVLRDAKSTQPVTR